MPQLEANELYTIAEAFLTNHHNSGGCKSCHGGSVGVNPKDTAHAGYIADPSMMDEEHCTPCHSDLVMYHETSVHSDQTGYKTLLMARAGGTELTSDMEEMLDDRCFECHTTCGQCHISQPDSVNGGLLDGHIFKGTPNQTRNCTACHGSRIGAEFRGENTGLLPSVHYSKGMNCFDCHTGDEIHGPDSAADNRYKVAARPKCIDCHSISDENKFHEKHNGTVACQVCHSQQYKNCYKCHVAKPGSPVPHGLQIPSEIDFKIGRNPIKSDTHPWDFVLLRHIPITPDTFSEYDIELPEFGSLPTWKYTSPHNIQRNTPQTESCGSCHGKTNLFLTEGYILIKKAMGHMVDEEIEANEDVIVDEIPD